MKTNLSWSPLPSEHCGASQQPYQPMSWLIGFGLKLRSSWQRVTDYGEYVAVFFAPSGNLLACRCSKNKSISIQLQIIDTYQSLRSRTDGRPCAHQAETGPDYSPGLVDSEGSASAHLKQGSAFPSNIVSMDVRQTISGCVPDDLIKQVPTYLCKAMRRNVDPMRSRSLS